MDEYYKARSKYLEILEEDLFSQMDFTVVRDSCNIPCEFNNFKSIFDKDTFLEYVKVKGGHMESFYIQEDILTVVTSNYESYPEFFLDLLERHSNLDLTFDQCDERNDGYQMWKIKLN